MKLIVGLGNPGEKYESTRHNLGFMVLEKFLQDLSSVKQTLWENSKKLKSDTAVIDWKSKHAAKSEKVLLVKPQTFMNSSGIAVSLVASFYKVLPEDIWVVHDELDLPLGSIKIRTGGSSAGHKGVESIITSLGTEKFWRFRLGISESHNHEEIAGKKMHDVDEYVLGQFTQHQAGKVRELIKHATKALKTALDEDLTSAMNKYNTK
jgi:peptidyl-tRNA hydrolase, PTH1 family